MPPQVKPLTITAPPDQMRESPDGNSVAVVWPNAKTTGGKPPIKLGYDPPNGSVFPVGVWPVKATVKSKDGQRATASFQVVVSQQDPPSLPADPTNLSGQQTGPAEVTIEWQQTPPPVTTFPVERRTGGAAFTQIGETGNNTPRYQDSMVAADTYDYRVKATNAAGSSGYSNVATVTVSITAPAFDFVVDPINGHDAPNITGSIGQPFRTMNYAVGFLGPGKTLAGRGGTYPELLNHNIPPGTSWDAKVRLTNFPGEVVTLRPTSTAGGLNVLEFDNNQQFIEIDGLNLDARLLSHAEGICCVKMYSNVLALAGQQLAHDIRVWNSEMFRPVGVPGQIVLAVCQQSGFQQNLHLFRVVGHGKGFDNFDNGLYLQGKGNKVDECDIYDVIGSGIQIYEGNHNDQQAIVSNTKVHDISGSQDQTNGIVLKGHDSQVYNCLVYNITATNNGFGIYWFSGITNGKCWSNTAFNVKNFGIRIEPGFNVDVIDNIAYATVSGAGNNLVNLGSGTASKNLTDGTNPQFTNPGAGNFIPLAGSPARNAGENLTALFKRDLDGTARPSSGPWTIGCYE